MPGTGYPEGERFTLQLIEFLGGPARKVVEQLWRVGYDAAFSSGTQARKPSGVLLHYNYGAAAVKWWGHHTDVLRARGPPHPPSPPPPTSTHDRSIAIKKREGHSSSRSSKKKG